MSKHLKTILEDILSEFEAEFSDRNFCLCSEQVFAKAVYKKANESNDEIPFEIEMSFSRDPAYKSLSVSPSFYSSDFSEAVFEKVKKYLEKADHWLLSVSSASEKDKTQVEIKSSEQPAALSCSSDFKYKITLKYVCCRKEA